MDKEMPYVDENLAQIHEAASHYAVDVNFAISDQFEKKHPYPLAGGALYRLQADTLSFHEAVFALCVAGYVSCSAPLLRTQLDLLLSTAIIVHRRDEAEIRGFRCTHYFLKTMFIRSDADAQLRKRARQQIDFGIARLSAADQEKARDFIFKDRLPAYWYAPDYYHRPQEAADELLRDDMALYYATLSSAAHGGFLGLGLFRDQPDAIHPSPRENPRAQSLTACTSTRIVLDQANARDRFELGGLFSHTYENLVEQLSKLLPSDAPPNAILTG
jgi:hypothetical protein